jgi:signal transduction histidine kinase
VIVAGVGVYVAAVNVIERRRAYQRLEAAADVTRAVLEGREMNEILEIIAGRARELAAGAVGWAVTRDNDPEGTSWPEVLEGGKPVIVPDLSKETHPLPSVMQPAALGPALAIPLTARGDPFGMILVARDKGAHGFSQVELPTMQAFATQAAIALDYARAQSELQRLAVIEDRERIATDLHDGVIQSLFGVGMELQAARATLHEPDLVGMHVSQSLQDLDRAMRDLRGYIHGLEPVVLAGRQLSDALQLLATDFQAKTGVHVRLSVDPETAINAGSLAAQLVQIAREALSNVARHAQATKCELTLVRDGNRAVLQVLDNGRGFNPEEAAGHGLGLHNIRQRAASFGGTVTVESAPAKGTRVRVSVALPDNGRAPFRAPARDH